MTRLVAKTLREAPADAEAISHRLLVRAGYIRRISSGVYSYLPLGFRVLRKIESIVREEFDAAGAQELLLPALQPIELWEETGRTKTMDDVLMRLEVRGADFVLGPTHEEAVIATVAQDIASYRDLPATVYQIQTKFRAEARPRFGLLRTREFIMADAYSFDADQEGMRASYRAIFDAYCRAFDRLGVTYYPVEADAGSIGGDVNHEFMVPAAIGEDHFALCASCGYKANIEAARRAAPEAEGSVAVPEMTEISTPGATTIDSAVAMISKAGYPMTSADMLKTFVASDDQGRLALFLVPGDRQVRLPHGYSPLDGDAFAGHPFLYRGYVAPMGMQARKLKVFADRSIKVARGWTTGANRPDTHVINALIGRDFEVDEFGDLVVVEDGDACPQCGEPLSLVRSVEAGHTFQLGLTYPEKIPSARFSAEDGSEAMYFMGCYGIGVSRLPAVVAEVTSDDQGLNWPISVAPFQVHLVAISHRRDPEVARVAEELYSSLGAAGIEVLFDDRDLAPGVKLNDADLIGVPVQLLIGPKGIASGVVELKRRKDRIRREVTVEDAQSATISLVAELFAEL
ncbi:MAG: proline--tRNA ligase [Nitrospiraceae bacterium]|nr:proline--tRNA ligase [Nitrospiraceae bacterium]